MRLGAITAAFVLVVASAAEAKTWIFTRGVGNLTVFVQHPERLRYAAPNDDVAGKVRFNRLKWSRWGQARATAEGRIVICPKSGRCAAPEPAGVVAQRPRRGIEEYDGDRYYTRLRATYGQNRLTIRLPVLDLSGKPAE